MANIQNSRLIIKRSSTPGDVPTVGPSNDHTDGTWGVLDIYNGEFFINDPDEKLFYAANDVITEVTSSSPSATSFAVDLDNAESSVTRSVSGGRTYFDVVHSLASLDVVVQFVRLSDGRTVSMRLERTGVNDVQASRAGDVASGVYRVLIIKI